MRPKSSYRCALESFWRLTQVPSSCGATILRASFVSSSVAAEDAQILVDIAESRALIYEPQQQYSCTAFVGGIGPLITGKTCQSHTFLPHVVEADNGDALGQFTFVPGVPR